MTEATVTLESDVKNDIVTVQEAHAFLNKCKELGSYVSPTELSKFRGRNLQTLDVLANDFKEKMPPVEKGSWAIVIPAHKERDIGEILGMIVTQMKIQPDDEILGFKKAQIIVGINNETEGDITEKAISQFLKVNPLPNRMSVKFIKTPEQGKLVAFDAVLDNLANQSSSPEYLFFFDADSKLKDGCISSMHNLLLGNTFKACGPKIVQNEPQNIREAISQLPTLGHGKRGTSWLQGGAFAIKTELAPLYHAYVKAFPGTIANDVNWSMIMREKNIPFRLTDNEYLEMEAPSNIYDLIKQQNRWLQGARLSAAFINSDPNQITETSVMTSSPFLRTGYPPLKEDDISAFDSSTGLRPWFSRNAVIKRFSSRVKGYFPDFPHVTKENISDFVDRGLKKEIWGAPFYAGLFLAIDKLKQPIKLSIQGKEVEVGGPPQSPYIARGWQSPR